MAVYREGFEILFTLLSESGKIYPDAEDRGTVIEKDSNKWYMLKQLVSWYGIPETRKVTEYSTGCTVEEEIKLVDEWAVSDEQKTLEEATLRLKVIYVSTKAPNIFKNYVYFNVLDKEYGWIFYTGHYGLIKLSK